MAQSESLTEEEQDFMRTMEQVDVWYEAEMAKAEQKAKQENQKEIALRMLQENIPLDVIARITQLTISELEGFANEQLQSLQSQPGNN
jgi:predicted Rossmann fold nucleotide-binding protein DprA/Smf involved in DNA uptake